MSDRKVVEGRFFKLRSLDCIEDINLRINSGDTMPNIAKWMQNELKIYTDVGYKSLVVILSKYRNDYLPPMEIAQNAVLTKHSEAIERVQKGLDEIEEIEWLYQLQKDRIEIGTKFEKKLGFLNKNLNVDVALALQILRRKHEIKMDLGFNGGRDLGTMNIRPDFMVDLKNNYGDKAYNAFLNPESRSKVLGAMKVLLDQSTNSTDVVDVSVEE